MPALPDQNAAAQAYLQQPSRGGLAASLGLTGDYRQQARSAVSANSELAQQAAAEESSSRMKALDNQIAVFAALDSISEQQTTAWFCSTCNRVFFNRNPLCLQQGHELVARRTVKRFYRCGRCKNGRMPALGELPPIGIPCLKCGESAWERVSAAGGPDGRTSFESSEVKENAPSAAGAATTASSTSQQQQRPPTATPAKVLPGKVPPRRVVL
jgi:hypothetical protein